MLEIIYDEANNSVESFYLEFVHEFFKSIYKTK